MTAALSNTVNFRDVGRALASLGSAGLPEGRLLRSGSLAGVSDPTQVGSPRTILNFHRTPDTLAWFDGATEHLPLADRDSTYDARDKKTRKWLLAAMARVVERDAPLLVHCLAGRDRTGVFVAALLTVLGFDRQTVVREFALSDGADTRRIQRFLDSLGDAEAYFRRVNVAAIRRLFLAR